ncbi:Hydrophobin 2 [Mycena venus]|uniref:Hydrophobin n=1 Tax=Mycena venus TaxID=2733690 RepID=A0A8H7D8B9_9AGAR|nr:Hydrophobin 2 [Mycena venus]
MAGQRTYKRLVGSASNLSRLPSFAVQPLSQANMFSKLSVVVTSVLITLAAAAPSSAPTSAQCCTSVQSSSSNAVSAIAGLLGLDLAGLNVPVGLGCSPITVIGNNCGSTTVNCEAPEKQWGGLIAINCIPITL